MPFVHIDGNGAATRFAPQDERLISNARMRGDRSVRVTDVQLPNGQILQFEVRFDTNATSKRWHTPPTSGMIQVNLRNDNTRLVEYRLEEDQLTAGRKAVSAAADTRAAGEPELEPELEPEPEREPEPDADRSLWECSFEETWKPYSDDIQAKLRAAYAADPTSTCHFEETRHFPAKGRYQAKTETFKYSVDFSAGPDFRQLNLKSNKERPVRRLGCWCRTPDARAAADSAPLRILCIDGGGSKGLVPAIIMQRIEQMCAPHRVDELFDVVAGTSTGGILALGTCIARVPAAEMAKVYETRADEIWTKKGGLTGFLSPVAAKASYDAQKLECILKSTRSRHGQLGAMAVVQVPPPLPLGGSCGWTSRIPAPRRRLSWPRKKAKLPRSPSRSSSSAPTQARPLEEPRGAAIARSGRRAAPPPRRRPTSTRTKWAARAMLTAVS
jgi:hypothetical protein